MIKVDISNVWGELALPDLLAMEKEVAAAHNTEARGICTQNDIGYLKATNMDEMQVGVVTLLTQQADRPMVLEVFTDAAEDAKAMREYFESLK